MKSTFDPFFPSLQVNQPARPLEPSWRPPPIDPSKLVTWGGRLPPQTISWSGRSPFLPKPDQNLAENRPKIDLFCPLKREKWPKKFKKTKKFDRFCPSESQRSFSQTYFGPFLAKWVKKAQKLVTWGGRSEVLKRAFAGPWPGRARSWLPKFQKSSIFLKIQKSPWAIFWSSLRLATPVVDYLILKFRKPREQKFSIYPSQYGGGWPSRWILRRFGVRFKSGKKWPQALNPMEGMIGSQKLSPRA